MNDKSLDNPNSHASRTLTDDQMVTEKRVPRRSFLTNSGVLLAGAAAIVSGVRATAGGRPDDTKRHDPDKPADPKRDDRDREDRKRDDRDRDKRPDDRGKKPPDRSRM